MPRKSTLTNAIIWIGLALLAAMPMFLFWYFFVSIDYIHTYYYDGVGLGTDTSDSNTILYSQDDQRQCFVVQRGSTGSALSTDSVLVEVLIIDIPIQRSPNRIDMGESNIRVGFVANRGFGHNYSIGKRGVTGYFDITSIRKNSISATFEIVVHANVGIRDSSPMPQDYTFTGERKFVLKDNTDVRYGGRLWPNLRPKQ